MGVLIEPDIADIDKAIEWKAPKVTPHSPLSEDEDYAVRTVIGEAKNQGRKGWDAVAGVIRNRSQKSGESLKQVVLAPKQFEPWSSRKRELESIDPSSPTYRQVAQSVVPVLRGEAPDPTNGADHFYAPKAQAALGRSAPSWENGKGIDIGDHRFFKLGYKGSGQKATNGSDDLSKIDKALGWSPNLASSDLSDIDRQLGWTPPDNQGGQPVSPTVATPQTIPPITPPVTELPETIQAQMNSAADPNVKTRSAVLTTDPSQNQLFGNSNFIGVPVDEGMLWVDPAKAKKHKLKTSEDIAQFVKQNPDVAWKWLGIQQPVPDTSGNQPAVTATHPQTGVELASAATPTPEAAQQQAQAYQDQFPGANIQATTGDSVIANRAEQPIDLTQPSAQYPYQTAGQQVPQSLGTNVASNVARSTTPTSPPPTQMASATLNKVGVSDSRQFATDGGVISNVDYDPKTGQPLTTLGTPVDETPKRTQQGGEALGIVGVDPNWSDEEKVRYAANKVLLGRETPTGPVTPEDIDKWIEASKATGNKDALVQGDRSLKQFAVFPEMLNDIFAAKKKTPEQLASEVKERTIAPPTNDEYRQRAIQEIIKEGQASNLNRFDRDAPDYKPFDPSNISEDAINAKVEEFKAQELNSEAKSRAYDVAQQDKGNLGSLWGGVTGGAGSIMHTAAGVLRPFSSFIPGYEILRDTGKEMQAVSGYRNQGKGAKDAGESIAQFVGETVPQLAEMTLLPGGAIGKFAFLGAAKSAGAGDNASKIAQAATEGTLTGKLFGVADELEKPLARLGTVFGGSLVVNAAMGVSLDQNIQKTLLNTAFEAQNTFGAKALGKVYRFWKGGEPYDLHITPKGEVDLLPTDPKRTIDGGEVVTDPKNAAYPDPIKNLHERLVKPVADASTDDLKKKVVPPKVEAPLDAEKQLDTTTPEDVGKAKEMIATKPADVPFEDGTKGYIDESGMLQDAEPAKTDTVTVDTAAKVRDFEAQMGRSPFEAERRALGRADTSVKDVVKGLTPENQKANKASAVDRAKAIDEGAETVAHPDILQTAEDIVKQHNAERPQMKRLWERPLDSLGIQPEVYGPKRFGLVDENGNAVGNVKTSSAGVDYQEPYRFDNYEQGKKRIATLHRQEVMRALKRGESVPSDVLSYYPDLEQKYGQKSRTDSAENIDASTPPTARAESGKGDTHGQLGEGSSGRESYGAKNKIVTADRAQKARELLAKKLTGTQLNTGLDPEVLQAGAELAAFHVEAGARKFADFSKKMVEDVGENIRPHLEKLYAQVQRNHNFEGMNDISPIVQMGKGAKGTPSGATEPKASKIGISIEAKTVADDLSKGFEGTAEYDPVTVKEQAKRATDLVNNDLEKARNILNGREKLPDGLRAAPLIDAVERYARKTKDVKLLRDIASSHLVSETSIHAQEMRLMAERHPLSPVKLIQEVQKARQGIAKKRYRNQTVTDVVNEIKKNVPKQKPRDWVSLVESLKCT